MVLTIDCISFFLFCLVLLLLEYELNDKINCDEDRLALCNLSTLERRRLRCDLIQAFKLLKGLYQINYNNFFVSDVNTSRRDHTLKVAKSRARLDIRLHSFSHRVINCWNNLPVEIVKFRSINNFKYNLSMFLSTRHVLSTNSE